MFRFPRIDIDRLSFWIGFVTGILVLWFFGIFRPTVKNLWLQLQERRNAARESGKSNIEENFRKQVLRRAQGMHVASSLFSLDEIAVSPRVIAPPTRIEPGTPPVTEDLVSANIPYTPDWTDIPTIFNAHSLSLTEVTSGGHNIILIGPPGAGKTFALAHFASQLARREVTDEALNTKVPFLLHIADIGLPLANQAEPLAPIIDFYAEETPVLDLPRFSGFVQRTFESGRALLVLDGLDELSPDGVRTAVEYLRLITKTFPNVQFVTAGAVEFIDGLTGLHGFPVGLLAWSEVDCQQFFNRWAKNWENYVINEAWAQSNLERIDSVLLANWMNSDNDHLSPLDFTLKTWAAFAGDSSGPTAIDNIWTHIRRLVPRDIPIQAAEVLSLQLHLTGETVFDPRKANEWVKSFEPAEIEEAVTESDAEEAKSAKTRTPKGKETISRPRGLLNKLADSGLLESHFPNRMRFSHPLFGHFLAGRALLSYNPMPLAQQQPWSGKSNALRYFSAMGDSSQVVASILEENDPLLESHLMMVARWLQTAPRTAGWRNMVLSRLVALIQNEDIPMALRSKAVTAVVVSADPAGAALFRQLARSPSSHIRQLAAIGSGSIKDTKAVQDLVNLMGDSFLSVRQTACLALVAIGTDEAMEAVGSALLHGDEELRRAAAESLANHRGEGHLMLRDGATMEDILVRRAVVYGMARIDDPWAFETLQKMQIEDAQWVVRNAATEILDLMRRSDSRIPKPLTPPSNSPWLIEFASRQGLGVASGSVAIDLLLAALKSNKVEDRLAALQYLRQTPTEGVIRSLYEIMVSDDLELKDSAYQVLWEFSISGVDLPDPQKFGLN